MKTTQKISWVLFGLGIFFLFWIGLLFASQGKPFWMDESDGWFQTQSLSIPRMLIEGGTSGASRSPLPYIIDRALLSAWNDQPLVWWDLRMFFRIPPTFFWALSNTFLFFFLRRKLTRLLGNQSFTIFIVSLTGTFFVFTNSFSAYYAIEARAYSLWTSLTLIQTCFLWNLMTEKQNRANFAGFLLANYLLVFATYASSLQVGLTCGLLLLNDRIIHQKWRFFAEPQRWILATGLGSAAITLFYYVKVPMMGYPPFPFHSYLHEVLEVILKSFRHHGTQQAWVSFPLLFGVIPYFWWKRNKSLALLCLNAHLGILLTYVHYRASLANGGLYASRYAAYLVPSLSLLYALGIFTLLMQISKWVKRKWHKEVLIPLIVIYCLANVIPWVKTYTKGIPADISRFKARNSHWENSDPKCREPLEHDPEPLENQNNYCRKI